MEPMDNSLSGERISIIEWTDLYSAELYVLFFLKKQNKSVITVMNLSTCHLASTFQCNNVQQYFQQSGCKK